jgi:tetratricopeptide (TPR) repeat protein
MNLIEKFLDQGYKFHCEAKLDLAAVSYGHALKIDPNHFDALHLMGLVELENKRFDQAVIYFTKAIEIDRHRACAYNHLGNALSALHLYPYALDSYEAARTLEPENPSILNNKAMLLMEMRQYSEALSVLDSSIILNKHIAQSHSNRGLILRQLGRLEEAIDSHRRALTIDPANPKSHVNHGLALKDLGCLSDALVSYERAIEMQPDYVEAHWNKSLALLLGGQLREGFELFEWRWKLQKTELKPREFKVPLWLGEQDLAGQTIMIHHEQGLGDGIQFCRYVPLLKELGARVLLVVPKPLVTLMLSLQGVDEVIESGQALPEFDFHCPMLSLPLAFKTDLSTIPLAQGYLSADPLKSEAWRKKLGEKRRLRVGVVWNGGAKAKESEFWSANGRRNIELSEFAQALSGLDVDFYSLQKGDPAESEIRGREAEYWPEGNFFNHVDDLKDFSDTAALVEQLDLVISVDTSTAHLAAAMGKPTWILNRFDTCWRWLLQRRDSPWYQSVTLYRQETPRNWIPILQKLRHDLHCYTLGLGCMFNS